MKSRAVKKPLAQSFTRFCLFKSHQRDDGLSTFGFKFGVGRIHIDDSRLLDHHQHHHVFAMLVPKIFERELVADIGQLWPIAVLIDFLQPVLVPSVREQLSAFGYLANLGSLTFSGIPRR